MDLQNLIERLLISGDVEAIRANPLAQFGRPTKTYLGATLLPEKETENDFEESGIRFRTIIANDGDRYSPAQKKGQGQALWQTIHVELGNSDIAREFTGRDYDGMLELFNNGMDMQAAAAILEWLDVEVNLALVELNEKQRWEAITNAVVNRRGDNGYYEPVYYHNPPGHRVNAAGTWSDPNYDPWPDIVQINYALRRTGYYVNRIVTSTTVHQILLQNPKIAQRVGANPIIVVPGGTIQTLTTGIIITQDRLDGLFTANRLPALEVFDEFYSTQVGNARFSDENTMFFFCTTGRDLRILVPAAQEQVLIQNTLGYTGIGRPVGKPNKGRNFFVQAYNNKPPRIEAEGWQTSLPVILDPLAFALIKNIS